MAMGIVSDDDLIKEVNRLDINKTKPLIPTLIRDIPNKDRDRGRGEGSVEVPNSLRNIIGETSVSGSRADALELARNFGISSSSVSAYSKGATSTATYDETPNKNNIVAAKNKIGVKARNRAIMALNEITEDRLKMCGTRELASIARDMTIVSGNMEGNINQTEQNRPQFIVYAPQVMMESKFQTIILKE